VLARRVKTGAASARANTDWLADTVAANNDGFGGRSAYSALCLACGRATSEYLWPRGGVMREAPVSGSESPPCVAVARLRRAVFSPPSG
jgi:hypothetical protein